MYAPRQIEYLSKRLLPSLRQSSVQKGGAYFWEPMVYRKLPKYRHPYIPDTQCGTYSVRIREVPPL